MTRHLPRIFWWHAIRDLRRHPLLSALNVLSIALGITVYLAIQIANGSANRAFAATVDLVAGKAHLELRGTVDEKLWPTVAAVPDVAAVTGLVEGVATLPDFPGEYLRIIGIDAFTSPKFVTFRLSQRPEDFDFEQWLATRNGVAIGAETARRLHVTRGDRVKGIVNGSTQWLTVMSILDTSDSEAGDSRIGVMDIGWAQELLGMQGRLSALLILLKDPNQLGAASRRLNEMLPQSLQAQPPRQRSAQLQQMVSAFQLNLTALSMVSLLVGVFLVYNTVSASVTRRRREIGILRAMGATRNEIRALFLGEAGVFGLVGIALGCVGGIALSPMLAQAVGRTISSLYVLVTIGHVGPTVFQLLVATIFGLAAVLVGAWMPSDEAARIDPVKVLSLGHTVEDGAQSIACYTAAAVVSLVLAILFAIIALQSFAPSAFAAAFFVLLAWALLAPPGVALSGAIVRRCVRPTAILTRLAGDRFSRTLRRNSITVAALCSAIAMMIGLTVMIASFRRTVMGWIDTVIVADLLVAPSSNEIVGLGALVPADLLTDLQNNPDISSVDTFREQRVPVSVGSAEARLALLVVPGGTFRNNITFRTGDSAEIGQRIFRGEAVAVSEPFARKLKVREGDSLKIISPKGPVVLTIAGVYPDYSRDEGVVLISRAGFDRFWVEPGVQSLAVYLRNSSRVKAVADEIRAKWSREGQLSIYSNRALRERVLNVFDQTFAVTALLRVIAIGVAVIGIFLSISTLVLERERETGTLRAIGASPSQIMRLIVLEAIFIGIVAALLGSGAGATLAVVLTKVVNPAFFGWSIHVYWPWAVLASTPIWIVLAAIGAAWLPARRATFINIAQAVREE